MNQERPKRTGKGGQGRALSNIVPRNGCNEKEAAGTGVRSPAPAALVRERFGEPIQEGQPEGVSFTKVSRGGWIRTSDLLNPIQEPQGHNHVSSQQDTEIASA